MDPIFFIGMVGLSFIPLAVLIILQFSKLIPFLHPKKTGIRCPFIFPIIQAGILQFLLKKTSGLNPANGITSAPSSLFRILKESLKHSGIYSLLTRSWTVPATGPLAKVILCF